MLKNSSKYGLIFLFACSMHWLWNAADVAQTTGGSNEQPGDSKRPWKGYAILGNGNLTAVYSDDDRISAITRHRGIHHFYFQNYTADYVASTAFDVLDGNGQPIEGATASALGMKNFFTTQTQMRLKNGATETILCFIHPAGAAVLSLRTTGAGGRRRYRRMRMCDSPSKREPMASV